MASSSSMNTPPSLLERLRQPADAAAWGRFVELYTPLLYYWLRRAGLQEADAADLVQEVLTVLFQKLPEFQYDPHKSFRGWLRTITLNKWRESRRRRPFPPGLEAGHEELAGEDDLAALEEAEYREHLVKQALRLLRAELPANTWRAFELHFLDGLPAQETADRLGLRIGTVYAAKSRVLTRLRRELDGLLG